MTLKVFQPTTFKGGLKNYVNTFDPHMVEIAAILVKKWGQRSLQTQEY